MGSSSRYILVLLVIAFTVLCFTSAATYAGGNIGVCIRNCAQCRDMYGTYFKIRKCADFCVKYKGKFIPDCEDEESIRMFLQEAETDY